MLCLICECDLRHKVIGIIYSPQNILIDVGCDECNIVGVKVLQTECLNLDQMGYLCFLSPRGYYTNMKYSFFFLWLIEK